jgi:adenine-specific DNA-methyltransferase
MSIGTDELKVMILAEVPADGAAIGNQSLLAALRKQQPKLTEAKYQEARDELISEGELAKGGGRGGSVFRTLSDDAEDEGVDDADRDNGDDSDEDEFEFELQEAPTAFEFEVQEAPTRHPGRVGKKTKKRSSASGPAQVLSYRHPDKRANNPEVGMVHVQISPKNRK